MRNHRSRVKTFMDGINFAAIGPTRDGKARTQFEAFYEELGKRLGKRMFEDMVARQNLEPTLSMSTAVGFGVAGLVHLTTLGLAALGVYLIVGGWPYIALVFFGLFSLVLAYSVVPRFASERHPFVSQKVFPTLYALTNRVASELHAPLVNHIVINTVYNATYGTLGWRRKPVLTLGFPLLAVATPQEIVGLIGHEIAHSVNHDPTRTLFVSGAIQTLARWYSILYSRYYRRGATAFAEILMHAVAVIPRLLGMALTRLLWRQMQRAEYLADYLGARIGGTASSVTLLQKAHYPDTFSNAAFRYGMGDQSEGLIASMRREMAAIRFEDIKTSNEEKSLLDASLDVTHPPTGYRIRFLEAHPIDQPAITLSTDESAALEQELGIIEKTFEPLVIREYQPNVGYKQSYQAAVKDMRACRRKK